MISALFVRSDSIYKTLGLDCYDQARDARNFPGDNPVIAHPPCRAWSRLKHFAKPDPGEKELGLWAVDLVRSCGGVLEHPISTGLIEAKELPSKGGRDKFGGFCLSVDQSWWGHPCRKTTLLYICGCELSDIPSMPLSFDAIQYRIGGLKKANKAGVYRFHNKGLKSLNRAENDKTPHDFALFLIRIAEQCRPGALGTLDSFIRATIPSN